MEHSLHDTPRTATTRRALLGRLAGGAAAMACVSAPSIATAKPLSPHLERALARREEMGVDPWAIASAPPRGASLVHAATGERFQGVYFESGHYAPDAMAEINWLMRDVRVDEAHQMHGALVDLLSEIQTRIGGRELTVTSGYRCWKTNARTRGAARNSLHMRGMAVDFYARGVSARRLARVAVEAGRGGVGLYDRRGFVHIDVGAVRYWRG